MIKELYESAIDFNTLKNTALAEEKELYEYTKSNVNFNEDSIEKIKSMNSNYKILVAAEMWCPYARAFLSCIDKAKELNSNLDFKFVTYGRGMYFMSDLINVDMDDFVIPTAIVFDENENIISKFIGYPSEYSNNFYAVKEDYFSGKKANEIIKAIIK